MCRASITPTKGGEVFTLPEIFKLVTDTDCFKLKPEKGYIWYTAIFPYVLSTWQYHVQWLRKLKFSLYPLNKSAPSPPLPSIGILPLNQRDHFRKRAFLSLQGHAANAMKLALRPTFGVFLTDLLTGNWYHHRANLGSAKLRSNANNLQPIAIKVNFPVWSATT